MKYTGNIQLLKEVIQRDNAILEQNYTEKDIKNNKFKINYTCSCGTINCEKTFINIHIKGGAFCRQCTLKNMTEKLKNFFIENYGVDNVSQSKEIKEKKKQTCKQNFGVEYPFQSKEIQEKIKETFLENYGVEYISQSKEIQDKIKETCLKNYGVEHPSQNKEIQEKTKQTCLENYGVEYSWQSDEVKEKIKQTCLEKYNVEYPSQNIEIQEKIKQTCLERHGVEHPAQSKEIQEKIKQTCLEKYRVTNPSQNPDVSEKSSKTAYSLKKYKFISGNEIDCQGYEPFALDELVKTIEEQDIITNRKEVPEIWYTDIYGTSRRHFVDIFIPSQNKCIEVKSTWTASKKEDNIFIKQDAAKQLGYTYEIWIYDKKGNKIKSYY
jgi:hypothetical protein